MGVNLSGNNSLGFFPQTINHSISSTIKDSLIVKVDEDDNATVTIHISEDTCIVCDLNGLSNEDIVKSREDPKALTQNKTCSCLS